MKNNPKKVIDTSVLIAILNQEQDSRALIKALAAADTLYMSAGSYLESAIVAFHQKGMGGLQKLDELLDAFSVKIESFDQEQAKQAIIAYQIYGAGQHPAKLNFGDCFSYALSKVRSSALLYKGNDFAQTDLAQADLGRAD